MFIQPKREFGIPYRSFIPKGIENMLLAGRCYSREFLVRSTGMPTCMVYGEAMGTAAAIAVRDQVNVRDVNIKEVQEKVHVDRKALTGKE